MAFRILRLTALIWVVTFAFALIVYLPAVDLQKDFFSSNPTRPEQMSDALTVLQIGSSWVPVGPIDEDPFSFQTRELNARNLGGKQKVNPDTGGGVCDSDSDCGGADQGLCNNTRCVCDEDYHGDFCQTERKSKLTAFLLQFLVGPIFGLPPGAGRIYLGYTAIGVGEIILGLAWLLLIVPLIIHFVLSVFCCGTGTACMAGSGNECCGFLGCLTATGLCGGGNLAISLFIIFLQIATSITALALWFYDWISILTDNLIEKGGIELINDM